MPSRTWRLMFWLTSNRGTKEAAIVELPRNLTELEIREKLESWCSRFDAWDHSDNRVSYGYKKAPKYSKLGKIDYNILRNMIFQVEPKSKKRV